MRGGSRDVRLSDVVRCDREAEEGQEAGTGHGAILRRSRREPERACQDRGRQHPRPGVEFREEQRHGDDEVRHIGVRQVCGRRVLREADVPGESDRGGPGEVLLCANHQDGRHGRGELVPDGGGEECDAECFFHLMDGWLEEMDGHVTASEWAAFSNYSDDEDGEGMSEEDFEGLSGLIDMYDYDESDGLDWDEFQDVWSMINSDDDESDDHHDESDEHHHHGDGDYHHEHSGDDESTHAESDRHHDHHDDHDDGDDHDDHGDQHEMPAVLIGYIAKNQTLNAPISDFETHFLSDCDEEYDEETDEMVEPDLDECTVEFSIPLSGGEANGVTHTYDDLDGDGLVSPGDMLTLEGWDGQTRLEMYDTWASEYSSDSVANPPALPGFGAMLAVMTLLGAALASRRD